MSGIFDSYFNSYPEPTHSNDEKAGINRIDLNQVFYDKINLNNRNI